MSTTEEEGEFCPWCQKRPTENVICSECAEILIFSSCEDADTDE